MFPSLLPLNLPPHPGLLPENVQEWHSATDRRFQTVIGSIVTRRDGAIALGTPKQEAPAARWALETDKFQIYSPVTPSEIAND